MSQQVKSPSTVNVTPNKKSGAIITVSTRNPEYGFMVVSQETVSMDAAGWVRISKRSSLLKGRIEELQRFLGAYAKGTSLPGRIFLREWVLSEVPEAYRARLRKDVPYEEAVQPFIKRAGEGGPELTLDGEPIVRFTDYVLAPTEGDQDLLQPHDNGAEVSAYRALKPAEAQL
jgi:hypothetical protein